MKASISLTALCCLTCSVSAQDAAAETAAFCGEGQTLCDEEGLQTGLAVSLLQRGAKRLLTAVQSSTADAAATSNDTVEVDYASQPTDSSQPGELKLTLSSRLRSSTMSAGYRHAVLLLERVRGRSCHDQHECKREVETILLITCTLLLLIVCIFTAFFFFREDKEEQVTPLCPQMVVRETSMFFKLSWALRSEKIDVTSLDDPSKIIAKVAMDWPDPFRPCASGIASTARLMNLAGMNMATVVARNCAVSGQALALCRHGCEIFGFVEPDTSMRYHVKHRTGVHLLTLVGDFANWNVDGVNPAGAVVFQAKKQDGHIVGKVMQHVDAGLMICCVIAAEVHRALQSPPPENPLPYDFDPDTSVPQEVDKAAKSSFISTSPVGEEQAGTQQESSLQARPSSGEMSVAGLPSTAGSMSEEDVEALAEGEQASGDVQAGGETHDY